MPFDARAPEQGNAEESVPMISIKTDYRSHRSSSDEEEGLPLYSEAAHASSSHSHASEMAVPVDAASAAEVRDFLVNILVTRSVPVEQARSVAAKWNVGTGRELRSYSADMFLAMFGVEYGWIIYKEARMRADRQARAQARIPRNTIARILLCLEAWLIVAWVKVKHSEGSRALLAVGAFYVGMAVLVAVGAVVGLLLQNPENTIEQKLRDAAAKINGASGPSTR